jgi:alkyl hydroperoxide reductase subunit AhpC
VIESKRVLKAFQFVTTHEGQVCPADWEEGKDTMVAEPEEMKIEIFLRMLEKSNVLILRGT